MVACASSGLRPASADPSPPSPRLPSLCSAASSTTTSCASAAAHTVRAPTGGSPAVGSSRGGGEGGGGGGGRGSGDGDGPETAPGTACSASADPEVVVGGGRDSEWRSDCLGGVDPCACGRGGAAVGVHADRLPGSGVALRPRRCAGATASAPASAVEAAAPGESSPTRLRAVLVLPRAAATSSATRDAGRDPPADAAAAATNDAIWWGEGVPAGRPLTVPREAVASAVGDGRRTAAALDDADDNASEPCEVDDASEAGVGGGGEAKARRGRGSKTTGDGDAAGGAMGGGDEQSPSGRRLWFPPVIPAMSLPPR